MCPEFRSGQFTFHEWEGAVNMNELVEDFLKESEVDFVGLWEIAQASREDLGAQIGEEVRKFSLEIVKTTIQ
jgi:hypothetical protein